MNTYIQPKVSVIIPNFNNAHYLKECLDSVAQQSYKNLEIIIVDDCSTDNSINIIKNYEKHDIRIRLIQNEINQKVSKTRDIGIKESTGNWITTLDSDDFYYSTKKIEEEMKLILTYNSNYNIAFSGIIHVTQQGNLLSKIMTSNTLKTGDIFEEIITRNCAIPRDFIFSKELYELVGGYDENIPLYEDWDLKIRLSKKANFLFTGIDGIAYRRHKNGLSSIKHDEHKKWIKLIFDKNSKELDNKDKLLKILEKNFNFKDQLDDSKKHLIISNLVNQIQNLKSDNFSIWGIGELTDMLLIELALLGSAKKINYIIDSKANEKSLIYYNKEVVTLDTALKNGERIFVLATRNNKDIIEKIILEKCKNLNINNFIILKTIT